VLTRRLRRPQDQIAQFLFQLRAAQQKTQRRAQVVQLFGQERCTCESPWEVEPGKGAVKQEELAGRLAVLPTSCGRLHHQQHPALVRRIPSPS